MIFCSAPGCIVGSVGRGDQRSLLAFHGHHPGTL